MSAAQASNVSLDRTGAAFALGFAAAEATAAPPLAKRLKAKKIDGKARRGRQKLRGPRAASHRAASGEITPRTRRHTARTRIAPR